MNLIQRALRVAVAGSMVVGLGVAAAAPAHAVTTDESCSIVKGKVTVAPGLTTTNQAETFKIKGTTSGCTGPEASGSMSASFSVTASCFNFPNGQSITVKTKWSSGKTSTANATFNVDTTNLTAHITGSVTTGEFTGDTFTTDQQYALKKGDCVTKPVTLVTYVQTAPLTLTH